MDKDNKKLVHYDLQIPQIDQINSKIKHFIYFNKTHNDTLVIV